MALLTCNTLKKYLKPSEEQELDQFLDNEPEPKRIYENADGEKRWVLRVDYPSGAITQETVFGTTRKDGSKNYHTPRASLSQRFARVMFRDMKTDVMAACGSVEWLEWCGESVTIEDAPKHEDSPAVKAAKTRMINQYKRKLVEDAEDEAVAGRQKAKQPPAKKKPGRPKKNG